MAYTFEQIGDQRERQAQTVHHQIGGRQADNKLVGGRTQLACGHHQPDDGRVADATGHENGHICHTQDDRLDRLVAQRPRRQRLAEQRRAIVELSRLRVVEQADPAAQIFVAGRRHVESVELVRALHLPAGYCFHIGANV